MRHGNSTMEQGVGVWEGERRHTRRGIESIFVLRRTLKIFNLATLCTFPSTQHNAIKMESKAATHEEIWDDSALVDSWNEALEEYKVSGQQLPLLRPRASWPSRPQADIAHRSTTASTPKAAQSTTSSKMMPKRCKPPPCPTLGKQEQCRQGNAGPRSPSNGTVGLGGMSMPSLKQAMQASLSQRRGQEKRRRERWMRRYPWTRATKHRTRQSRMAWAPWPRRR